MTLVMISMQIRFDRSITSGREEGDVEESQQLFLIFMHNHWSSCSNCRLELINQGKIYVIMIIACVDNS